MHSLNVVKEIQRMAVHLIRKKVYIIYKMCIQDLKNLFFLLYDVMYHTPDS